MSNNAAQNRFVDSVRKILSVSAAKSKSSKKAKGEKTAGDDRG